MIWVVFALPFEGRGFPERGEGFEKKVLNVCGAAAARRFEELLYLSTLKPERVILAGLAGGLNPELEVGDVLAQGESIASIRAGVVFTADEIIETPEKKRELRAKTGADCVDLETRPIADICLRRKIPFTSLRAISDSAIENLAVPGKILVNPAKMRTSVFEILIFFVSHPWKFSSFIRMVRNANLARERLLNYLGSSIGDSRKSFAFRQREDRRRQGR